MKTKRWLTISLLTAYVVAAPQLRPQTAQPEGTAGQRAEPALAYDLSTVKPNKSDSGNTDIWVRPASYTATNVSVKQLLMSAYGVTDSLIAGLPKWTDSARYDVQAKVSEPDMTRLSALTSAERRSMIADLLRQRFHLQAHLDQQMQEADELVLAKNGPKLKAFDATAPDGSEKTSPGSLSVLHGRLVATGVPVSSLTGHLISELGCLVVDRTGLTGLYDFSLSWKPSFEDGKDDGSQNADAAPDLRTALQEQLGLKLSRGKIEVTRLVIDHIEEPSPN